MAAKSEKKMAKQLEREKQGLAQYEEELARWKKAESTSDTCNRIVTYLHSAENDDYFVDPSGSDNNDYRKPPSTNTCNDNCTIS
mmetsp:Transcript_10620/g.22322  ORF Transcript_10620/g.22322 Transcript_10620/m.22322 type:complete len:84 (+) Transcript_10620:317-568(+)|eukprot:CAMPEP_0119543572 /NCGR_PEP_ID=MMETSP1344-20130328/54199_1 /TAXON_ID=236787 /ORGANISM="Florenciella parvula, Strain CCMP2471" /LENGTH=83 /DNA_ID=CAMNT_0007587887 /DNA_START=323 /DNA_END=574 /DNA_ORIENTATION=+